MSPSPNPPRVPRPPPPPALAAPERPRHARWTAGRTLWLFAAAGGLALGGFWLWPAQVLEVPRAQLVPQQGRLFRAGQSAPFTGWMSETYPSGAKQSRSQVVKGLLEGVSEGWHTNGQCAVKEHFHEGVSHGLRTKWYANGAKMSEVMIVRGKLHGTFRRWHENGTLAEQIEMRQGDAEGPSLAYYPSGFLKAQARLDHGKVCEQRFWPDGARRDPSPVAGSAHGGLNSR